MAALSDEQLSEQIYYKLLQSTAKNKPQKELKTNKWVTMMIDRIQGAKKIVASEGADKLHHLVKEALDNYDVLVSQTQKKRLVVKAKGKEPLKYVTPLEESHTIVMKAHTFTIHGGVNAMADWLSQSKIEVADICLPAVVETCKECQIKSKSKENSKKKYKSAGLVTIMDMGRHELQDEKFDCLLVYQHESTKFMKLRPFTSADMIDSIANEFTHIFTEIGPPQCLFVQPALKNIINCVLNERIQVLLNSKIDLEVDETNDEKVTEDIKAALLDWLAKDSERTWSAGCYIIQYTINNKLGEDGRSPLQRVRRSCVIEDLNEVNKNVPASENPLNSNDLHEEIILETVSQADVKTEPEEVEVVEDFISNTVALELPIEYQAKLIQM